jgi:hypothetical protein
MLINSCIHARGIFNTMGNRYVESTHMKNVTLHYSLTFVPFFFVTLFFDHWGKWS